FRFCVPRLAPVDRVVAGNDQPAFAGAVRDLNSDARAGRIPAPFGILGARSYVDRRGPRFALVIDAAYPHGACPLVGVALDLYFVVAPEIVRQQQPDCPGGVVDDGTRVAAGVLSVGPEHRLRAPGGAAVGGTAEHEVDVARIAARVLSGLAEGEQRSLA